MEIIILDKELINSKNDQQLYIFRHKVYNKSLLFIFKWKCYYVYHRNLGFSIIPFKDIVKNYINNNYK